MNGMKQTRVGFEVEVVTSTFVTPARLRDRCRGGRERLRRADVASEAEVEVEVEVELVASAFGAPTWVGRFEPSGHRNRCRRECVRCDHER
jgi:hypothetical protein